MIPLHSVRQFLRDMRRQKLRTLLTMFGIFWGSCSIVLLFAFGRGIAGAQLKSTRGLGDDIGIFWGGITSVEYKGLPKGRRIRPTEDDVILIKSKAQCLKAISPEFTRWSVLFSRGRKSVLQSVVGVWPEFGDMRNVIPQEGTRFINDMDMAERRRVIFIGNILKEDLFGTEDAIGQEILVNGVPFVVIGVMKKKDQDSSYSGRDSRKGFMPSSTFQAMYSHRYLADFIAQPKPTTTMELGRQEISQILGAKYKFDPSDKEAMSVWDTSKGFAFLRTFFLAFQFFLVGIGVATLITGGIGVTNIMNVVLEERTKEIGIKMALGAHKSYILWQFVFETLLITAVGGTLGFLFAWAVVAVFPSLHLEQYVGVPEINLWAGVAVTIILAIVGLVAGIFPARRAANLQPVQALKLF